MAQDKLATEQIGRHKDLQAKYKAVFEDDHQKLSQYFLPNQSDINQKKTEGITGWTDQIYDTTGIQSAQVLGAGLGNWWTPRNQNWAEYAPPGYKPKGDDNADDEGVKYLEVASDKMMRELGRSNFYAVKGMADNAFAVFATDCIVFDESENPNELFNFTHCKIGTYTVEEDYKGVVDTLRREFTMTYRQVMQKFGKKGDKIPDKMAEQAKGKDASKEFKILHCIFPRADSDRLPGRKDGAHKPFASVYIALDFNECIRVSGYDENPILCRRFQKWGTDAVWGYGPAYLAIPDARQVNYVQQYLDALAELHAYPRVLTPDNLVGDVDLRAGGNTVFDTSNTLGKPEEWATVGEYKLGLEMQEGRRQAIRDAFFVDAFKLLNSRPLIDKEMTAYEISQRQAEQLQGVAGIDARMEPEFISPLMKRGFGIMFRAGALGNAPQTMLKPVGPGKSALIQPEIVVTSRFNDALRALKNRGVEETIRFVMPIGEQKPEAWDWIDLDEGVPDYARNSGAGSIIRSAKKVAAIREARSQAMAQQRSAELADRMTAAAGNLGKAPPAIQAAVSKQFA